MVVSASEALARLNEGNARFVCDEPRHRYASAERDGLLAGQQPIAAVVGCSDSRVPVETVFDSGVGELFVVRTAGHVLTAAGLASLRFAMEKLGVRLIVVLGHEDCGAVAAAFEGDAPEWLQPIVRKIDVSLADAACAPHDADDELLAAAVDNHVRDTVRGVRAWICEFSGASGDVGSDDAPLVVGGAYKLASGEVHWLAV